MRIARVVMVCVALISTLFGAETERPKRRPQLTDHLLQPRPEDDSTTPITFTTLRSVATSFGHQIHPPSNRRFPRVRTSRFALIKIRESSGPKNNRHRRQLIRRGKKSHIGKSIDLHEAQKLETVYASPEVHEERVIHLEPIYRVTKNKNIFDSIIDLIRRIIDTKKTVGPLVGPFNLPGVGDKVYVRLLEQVPPDHLVIRLITHAPDVQIVKEAPAPIEIPKHPKIPASVSHETVVVHSDDLTNSLSQHNAISSPESDSLLSSNNNLMQILKPSGKLSQKVVANGSGNGMHFPRTYRMNEHTNSTNYPPFSTNNQLDWNLVERFNDSFKDQGANGYQDSFDQVYQFYPPLNETNQEDFEASNIDIREFSDSFNVSDFQHETGPIIPYRDYSLENQHGFKNEFIQSTEGPKYSLDFVSKKMRYLNMDGSVDSFTEDENFKPIERGPVLSKMVGSVNGRKRVVRRMLVKRKQAAQTNTDTNQKKVRGKNDEDISKAQKKSNDNRLNYLRNVTRLNENGNSTDLSGI